MTTTVTYNNSIVISDEERQRYLQQLQDQANITLIPANIFLVSLGLVGLVGNSLVLLVYSKSTLFKKNSTSIFIMAIAVFDLAQNVVTIPTEIVDKLHSWDFNNRPLCRARLYYNAFTTLCSGMILVAVAIARYRKICAPHGWQISTQHARRISIGVTILGMIFSIPYAITNGRQTKKTPREGIYGYECTVDDNYKGTIWPTLNNSFFLLLFVLCCTIMTVLYTRIGIQAWRHSKIYGIPKTSSVSMTPNCSSLNQKENGSNDSSTDTSSSIDAKFQVGSRKNEISNSSTQNAEERNDSITVYLEEAKEISYKNNSTEDCSGYIKESDKESAEMKRNANISEQSICLSERHGGDKHNAADDISNSQHENDKRHNKNDVSVCPSENLDNSAFNKASEGPDMKAVSDTEHPPPTITLKKRSVHENNSRKRPFSRTTAKLIIISVVFAVAFIPYLSVSFFRFIAPEKLATLNMDELSVIRLFLNSYLLNCGANPIIYSLCDIRFRKECLRLLKCCSRQ